MAATGYDYTVFIGEAAVAVNYVEGVETGVVFRTIDIGESVSVLQNKFVEMSTDTEPLGLLFELQWKKKPGGNNRDDVASIGIWDTPNASLDWVTFKSYVVSV